MTNLFLSMHPFTKNLLLTISSVFVALLFVELGLRYFYFTAEQRKLGAEALLRTYSNKYINSKTGEDEKCHFIDKVKPSAHFGYTLIRKDGCKTLSNSQGVVGKREIPFVKDPDNFSILVLGGSVAEGLITDDYLGRIFLENILNENYISPNGKPFRLYNGALGGWSMPVQNNVLTYYADRVDAAISIDGFNEAISSEKHRIEVGNFILYRYLVERSGFWPILLEGLKNFRDFSVDTAWLRHSYIVPFVFLKGMGTLQSLGDSGPGYANSADPFPIKWTKGRRDKWNARRYKQLIRQLHYQAQAYDIHYVHFVQPIRWLGKQLTDREESIPRLINVRLFKKFRDQALSLNEKGVKVFNLGDVYAGETGEIYADHIHHICEPSNDCRPGKILAEAIAKDLAQAWFLKSKKSLKRHR